MRNQGIPKRRVAYEDIVTLATQAAIFDPKGLHRLATVKSPVADIESDVDVVGIMTIEIRDNLIDRSDKSGRQGVDGLIENDIDMHNVSPLKTC